ncbi:MAG: peptidase [Gammaproteobacteria bacterium]|nr:peptidase [Gammaproteobacteria bacterium]
MTYCLGIKVNDGLVLASDSRTNAGVDYVNTYSKMFRFELGPQRIFVIVTSGNLATSQEVIQRLQHDLSNPAATTNLNTVPTLFEAAKYLGQTSQMVQEEHATALQRSGINGESYFILGGEISGQPHGIFLVYAQGNCISPSDENPFLQIGETKYGKPILDRVISPLTSLEDASRAALVSIDSTIRSNITVGPPVEISIVKQGCFQVNQYLKLEEQDIFYKSMTQRWNEGLRDSFNTLPRFPWESRTQPQEQQQRVELVPQPSPGPTSGAPQIQELSQQNCNQQQSGFSPSPTQPSGSPPSGS